MKFKALQDLTVVAFVDMYCDGAVYIHGAQEKYLQKDHIYTVNTLFDGQYCQLQEVDGPATHWFGINPTLQLNQLEQDGIICLERI